MTAAARLRALPPGRPRVRLELLRRHAAACRPTGATALFAVYALARRIDDVADGDLPVDEKLAALGRLRGDLDAIGASDDPVLVAVADAARRFPIPLEAFGDLVDGAELDVRGTEYATFAELERYCRCVAGSIGRLALGVFDCSDRERGGPLADDLGVALQIGNILRDVGEDARERPRLPAARGPRALRLRVDRRSLRRPGRARDRLRGAARARVARARARARAAARPPQRRRACSRWRASTAACSSGSPPSRRSSSAAGSRCARGRRASCSRARSSIGG